MPFLPILDSSVDRISISIPGVDLTDENQIFIDETIKHFVRRYLMTPHSEESISDCDEHFSLLCASRISSILPTPEAFSIKVFSEVCGGGSGDLCFGIATLQFLKKSFSAANVELLVLEEDYDHAIHLAPSLSGFIQSIDLESIQESSMETDILITAPVIQSYIADIFKNQPVEFRYCEYGMVPLPGDGSESIGCGVASWECGLQLSEKLREEAQRFRLGNRKEALLQLEFLNPELYRLLLSGKDLFLYDEDTSLFFGYANSSQEISSEKRDPYSFSLFQSVQQYETFQRSYFDMFCRIVLASENEKTKNIDIVLVGCFEEDLYHFLDGMKESAYLHNIRVIKIYDTPNILMEEFSTGLKEGKSIRIILSGSLPRNSFMSLMMASEDFTCVTGDMSFSEAISMDKTFLYQMMSGKEDHFNHYLALISEVFPNKEEPIRQFMEVMESVGNATISSSGDYERCVEMFASLLKEPILQEQMKILYDHLFKFYSFRTHLEGRIKGVYSREAFQRIETGVREVLIDSRERSQRA
ncbi:MAG TPA: hypothetical protein P5048_02760 [Chlamydiales bacterium]|nr:hypothetical protein [Chlamydiales bacterium]